MNRGKDGVGLQALVALHGQQLLALPNGASDLCIHASDHAIEPRSNLTDPPGIRSNATIDSHRVLQDGWPRDCRSHSESFCHLGADSRAPFEALVLPGVLFSFMDRFDRHLEGMRLADDAVTP